MSLSDECYELNCNIEDVDINKLHKHEMFGLFLIGEISSHMITEKLGVNFDELKMNKTVINPVEYISKILKDKGYGENLVLGHIKYDQKVNEDYDYQIIRSTSHDGTLIFTKMLIEEVLDLLISKKSYFKKTINEEELKNLKDIEYTIGDLVIESEYGKVSVGIGEISGEKQTVKIPVKCRYIF